MQHQRNFSTSSLIIGLLTITSLAWGHGVVNGAAQKVLINSSFAQKVGQPDTTSVSTVTSSQTLSSATSGTTAMVQVEPSEEQLPALSFTTDDFGDPDYDDIYGWDYDPNSQKEWKDSNYSSDYFIMRNSVVTMPDEDDGEGGVKRGKVYNVDSWKGGPNNQVSVAFYFSTEVG